MRAERKKPSGLSLVNIPPEITYIIINDLSSRDFMTLRQVSKAFYKYFTDEKLCQYAHKLYFGNSTEITQDVLKPYPTFPRRPYIEGGESRTRTDFEAAYQRTRNWKLGEPTEVEIIDGVADGSVGCHTSILVKPEDGLLVYQRSRGILVIKDLHRKGVQAETAIDLQAVLGECITMRNHNLLMREGESIRFRMNRGMLLVVGEAHEHPIVEVQQTQLQAPAENTWGYALWGWASWNGPAAPLPTTPRPRALTPPHSICAVFSVRPQDRGRLVQKWFEEDSFMTTAALNEHYCISEFHILEQRLEGVIFHPQESIVDVSTPPPPAPAHHFTFRKKTTYPQLSTFDIAPDTKGKVFFLGFLPPPDRRPVVEVITVPKKQEDGTWSEPTVIKRVVLRTLAKHVEATGAALLRSYWIDFEDGFEANKWTRAPANEKAKWKDGEDVVKLCLRGEFSIQGITKPDQVVKLITWYITARPSPHTPSTIQAWRNGQDWLDPEWNDPQRIVSPWADESGHVDLDECYPPPTYYTSPIRPENLIRYLPSLPDTVDGDRLELYPSPSQIWLKDETERKKLCCGLYYSENGFDVSKPIREDSVDSEYPDIPGKNDHDFVPPGRHLYAAYLAVLKTGRPVKNKRVWDRMMAESRAAAKKFTRGRTFVQALSECHRLAHGDDGGEDIREKEQALKSLVAKGVKGIPKHEELMPLPGNDNGGLKGVMDWNDKRFLVYGKCGTNPSRTQAESNSNKKNGVKDSDQIVIVRFD